MLGRKLYSSDLLSECNYRSNIGSQIRIVLNRTGLQVDLLSTFGSKWVSVYLQLAGILALMLGGSRIALKA